MISRKLIYFLEEGIITEMEDRSYFSIKIDSEKPIEINDFVGSFQGLAKELKKYIKEEYPDMEAESEIYIKEIRHGSFVIDMLPVFMPLIEYSGHFLVLEDFIVRWGGRIKTYFETDGRDQSASKSDLENILTTVNAVACDPKSSHQIDLVTHEDSLKKTKTVLKFSSKEAQTAAKELKNHILELEKKQSDLHERVVMFFERPSSADAKIGKRSGEKVIIEEINEKSKPLIYTSELAERQIKHEFLTSSENPFKKAFVVDVSVELKNGRRTGY